MSYNVGDVVNGHVLGSDNQWHPVPPGTATGTATATLAPAAPAPAPATSKPFYRRAWFIGVAGVAAVAVIAAVASGGKGSTPSADTGSAAAQAPAAAAPAAAGLNTPVRDGKFEFTVTNVECGKAQVGGQYFSEKAQGQFCLVSMTVTNIGTEPQYFDGSSQKAIDAQGRELGSDTSAAIYVEESKSFFEKINPGNTVKGVVVFDIPKTSTITQLKLHDSMFSTGTTVKVS